MSDDMNRAPAFPLVLVGQGPLGQPVQQVFAGLSQRRLMAAVIAGGIAGSLEARIADFNDDDDAAAHAARLALAITDRIIELTPTEKPEQTPRLVS